MAPTSSCVIEVSLAAGIQKGWCSSSLNAKTTVPGILPHDHIIRLNSYLFGFASPRAKMLAT
jgi:hypothetical protein